ncbi:MAG: hypothetical protein R2707_20625 [Acidimicrobiales bacterium]
MTKLIDPDTTPSIGDLARDARAMWRREPSVHGPLRTRIMSELTAVRVDLETLERKLDRSDLSVEDERSIHDCASRLQRLRLHWQAA